jgi:hypothetical protein
MAETIVSIHQPNFLPWLRLLDKILASDVFVAYDTVQYTKHEYHSRQQVLSPNGPAWLTVPVRHVRGSKQVIQDVRIDNSQPFRRKHLKLLRYSYSAEPYFDEVYPIIEDVYARDHGFLADLSLDLIEAMLAYLDTPVRVVRASSLPHAGDRTERLVDLVRNAGGSHHLTSTFGADHQDVEWWKFRRAEISVLAHRFEHPEYRQIGDEFVPNLAAIDMLFAHGRKVRETLASSRRVVPVDHHIPSG